MNSRQEQAVTRLISSYFKDTLRHMGVTRNCGCAVMQITKAEHLTDLMEHDLPKIKFIDAAGYSSTELYDIEATFEDFGIRLSEKGRDSFIGLTAVFDLLDKLDPENITVDLNNLTYAI